jgi:hypothetical protein
MAAKDAFELRDIEWSYTESNENTSSRHAPERIRTGITSATLHCNGCENEWRTTEGRGPGQFRRSLDGIFVVCPGCGAEEKVSPDARR